MKVIQGEGSLMAGQSVGLAKEVLPAKAIVEQLIEEAVAEAKGREISQPAGTQGRSMDRM